MRKSISILLAVMLVISTLALTACGGGNKEVDLSDSKYIGTWKTSGISIGDDSEALEEEYVLEIKEDGTGTLGSGDEVSEFTWSPVKGGFKTKGDVNATFKDDGDKIKAKVFIAELVFEKQ